MEKEKVSLLLLIDDNDGDKLLLVFFSFLALVKIYNVVESERIYLYRKSLDSTLQIFRIIF